LNQTQQEFCAALKAARERRGLKLTDISEATKVCPSYFSALERNDLRVWPKGLFRRSFFRAYAGTIGLPVEPTLAEFLRLFPEQEPVPTPPPAPVAKSIWQRVSEALQPLAGSNEAVEAPAEASERPWISDAKRVRPRDQQQPRFRIRIKVTP
jgi:transcriptional regulator with XRE-family HTH domain